MQIGLAITTCNSAKDLYILIYTIEYNDIL